jgi:hypothetical protein
MSPLLAVHIGAGVVGIVSGAAAVSVRKGERPHRAIGTVFFLCMLITSALAVYLALFMPPTSRGSAPPSASVSVGTLTFYLVATALMTVRRKVVGVGLFEKCALVLILGVAAGLLIFGLRSASPPRAQPGAYAPYFVFAAFATFAAALDLKVILRRGVSGAQRIARHLWRMCFALFFAAAFFFLGQQQVMPRFIRGSPILLMLAIAPLILLIFWMIRVRLTNWLGRGAIAAVLSGPHPSPSSSPSATTDAAPPRAS